MQRVGNAKNDVGAAVDKAVDLGAHVSFQRCPLILPYKGFDVAEVHSGDQSLRNVPSAQAFVDTIVEEPVIFCGCHVGAPTEDTDNFLAKRAVRQLFSLGRRYCAKLQYVCFLDQSHNLTRLELVPGEMTIDACAGAAWSVRVL